MDFVTQLALLIFVGIIGGLAALKLKTPLIVGYIFGGAVLALLVNFSHEELETINELAEIGIALLLFSIGIEFSLDKMMQVKKYAVYGGIAQIILTILFGVVFFPLIGFNSYESLFLGSVFSLSSTAVVIKVLEEIGQIETHASRIIVGWLILQDIAVVLLILFLGNFATGSINFAALFESLLKSFILIALALMVGRRVLPRVLSSVAKFGSKEILVVTAFGICLFFAVAAEEWVGSFTLGAFLAGLMLSESNLHFEIFSEIKPLQNIFTLFFFIIIGTLFSLTYLVENIFFVLMILVITTLVKGLLILMISLFLKMHVRSAIEVAIALAQVGEFAFLSASIGLENSWISDDLHSLIIAVTILSLLLTPLFITHTDTIYEKIRDFVGHRWPGLHRKLFMVPEEHSIDDKKLGNHIIVCGYGRVGKYIVLALKRMRFKHLLIEFDNQVVDELKEQGIDSLYGDATSEEILIQAGIESARAVIIALPKEADVAQIVKKVQVLNPDIKVILRRHFSNIEMDLDKKFSVVEPEFEAAIKILEKILPYLGKKDKKVLKWLRDQKDFLI